MKINIRVLAATLSAAACFFSLSASADDEVWNNSVRAGLYSVFYHTSATDLQGPYVPADVNFKAKNLETLYFGYVRRIWSPFDVELALGYPPLSKVEGRGIATVGSVPYNGVVVSSARWLSPTLLLEYRFLPESSKWQPYIGAGVNYTAFYDRVVNAQGAQAQGGPTRLSLTSSVACVHVLLDFQGQHQFDHGHRRHRADGANQVWTAGLGAVRRILFLAERNCFILGAIRKRRDSLKL
jgi:outer membrane protein W